MNIENIIECLQDHCDEYPSESCKQAIEDSKSIQKRIEELEEEIELFKHFYKALRYKDCNGCQFLVIQDDKQLTGGAVCSICTRASNTSDYYIRKT